MLFAHCIHSTITFLVNTKVGEYVQDAQVCAKL